MEKKWRRNIARITVELSRVDVIVNKTRLVSTLLDSGCDTYALVSSRLANRLQLQCIPISPRTMEEATLRMRKREEAKISEVAYFLMNIDGHQ